MNTVQFPGLGGLELTINNVAFTVFGKPVYWYGIIIAFGFMLAVLLAMKDSKRYDFEPDNIIDIVLFGAPVAIIAARLFYVIFDWENYRGNLMEIFNIRRGGLAIYGGVIGALITGYIFARVKKIDALKLFDFAMPYFALAQAIGRWGNFVNQEAFGTNTDLPWGMTSETVREYLTNNMESLRAMGMNVDPGIPVHPTFLYESLWNIGVFVFLIWFRKRKKLQGEVFFLYMILYGVGRFWIEGMRTDSLMLGSLRISQLLAGLFAVVLSAVFVFRRKKISEAEDGRIEVGTSSYASVLRTLREQQGEHEAETEDKEDKEDKEMEIYEKTDVQENVKTGEQKKSEKSMPDNNPEVEAVERDDEEKCEAGDDVLHKDKQRDN